MSRATSSAIRMLALTAKLRGMTPSFSVRSGIPMVMISRLMPMTRPDFATAATVLETGTKKGILLASRMKGVASLP